MTRINQLLKRIENLETLTQRLEQAIQDIRLSCACVRRKVDSFDDDWPEEPNDIDICYGPEEDDWPEEPEEIIEEND